MVGGKSKRSQDIIDLIPAEHKLYVEVFNDSVVVRELYKGFNIRPTKEISYTLGANASKVEKKVKEVFISNY